MEYGFQFANLGQARVRDLARVAKGEGYDLIVFPDHVVSRVRREYTTRTRWRTTSFSSRPSWQQPRPGFASDTWFCAISFAIR